MCASHVLEEKNGSEKIVPAAALTLGVINSYGSTDCTAAPSAWSAQRHRTPRRVNFIPGTWGYRAMRVKCQERKSNDTKKHKERINMQIFDFAVLGN